MKRVPDKVLLSWRLLLHRWAHFYHVLDKPQTEDRCYDANYNDLKAYETEFKCGTKNSPTNCVGCGCPICKPSSFDKNEKAIWELCIAKFKDKLEPAKVQKKSAKATTKTSKRR